jgi:hypothetical protein
MTARTDADAPASHDYGAWCDCGSGNATDLRL